MLQSENARPCFSPPYRSINRLRMQGMPFSDAILEGAALRLRPVLMTALVARLDRLKGVYKTKDRLTVLCREVTVCQLPMTRLSGRRG